MSPESQLKYLRPGRAGFDASLLSWVERYVEPGSAVWDVGANVGVFAFAAAGLGASVVAVEADPYMASLLLRSGQLNAELRVEIVSAAVSEVVGLATLRIASGGRAANALSPFAGGYVPFGAAIASVHVPTLTLDDLLQTFDRPTLVKIDIEGAELLALRGAARLLSEVRPTILIEVGDEAADSVTQILFAAGYQLRDAETGEQVSRCRYNTIATP